MAPPHVGADDDARVPWRHTRGATGVLCSRTARTGTRTRCRACTKEIGVLRYTDIAPPVLTLGVCILPLLVPVPYALRGTLYTSTWLPRNVAPSWRRAVATTTGRGRRSVPRSRTDGVLCTAPCTTRRCDGSWRIARAIQDARRSCPSWMRRGPASIVWVRLIYDKYDDSEMVVLASSRLE